MPTILVEKFVEFNFGDSWCVLRYDGTEETRDGRRVGHPFYREQVSRLAGTKAVDFVGVQADTGYLIEAKDFRGYRIQNRKRLATSDLAVEIAKKVRDPLAGLVAAKRNHPDPGVLGDVAAQGDPRQWKAEQALLADKIKSYMSWFSSRVLVVDQTTYQQHPSDLHARNLPGAGRSRNPWGGIGSEGQSGGLPV